MLSRFMTIPKDNFSQASETHNKVIYVLVLATLTQSIYPITAGTSLIPLFIYQVLYASLMLAGVLVARRAPHLMYLLIALGVIWLVVGNIYAFNQTAEWALLLAYGVIVVFQATVVRVLLAYIFTAQRVTREVIYAASAVYLLIGAIFVPIYGLIETVTFSQMDSHAFVDGQAEEVDEVFPWQTFIYYSYVTLTTAGYGDVLPVTMWARSVASLEAIIGVLYITIIMARLVGLYTSGQVEADLKTIRPDGV
jgi:hypothetical protein